MIITINGEKKEFTENLTFSTLLSELGVDARKVAVERNLNIVPRTTYAQTAVNDGDEIEIIKFIGGG
jgi:thiamine biosynthesis protein ThiS